MYFHFDLFACFPFCTAWRSPCKRNQAWLKPYRSRRKEETRKRNSHKIQKYANIIGVLSRVHNVIHWRVYLFSMLILRHNVQRVKAVTCISHVFSLIVCLIMTETSIHDFNFTYLTSLVLYQKILSCIFCLEAGFKLRNNRSLLNINILSSSRPLSQSNIYWHGYICVRAICIHFCGKAIIYT